MTVQPSLARIGILSAVLTLVAPSAAQDWKLEVVHLKNKERLEGLIVGETKDEVLLKRIIREAGSPTRAVSIPIGREEIERIEKLSEEDRKQLAERVEQLDPRGEREEVRMRALRLETAEWPGGGKAWAYTGKHFHILSNAREDIVRLVVVRLEEIFEAYVQNLGVRRKPDQLTRVILYKSRAEYQAAQRPGMNILNPAYYDPQKNEIVAASDLEERAEELDKLFQKHAAMMKELDDQERKLRKHYHGQPPQAMLAQVRQTRQRILVVNNQNRDTFERLNRPLFMTLYHEAFHAYLDNFVYANHELPVPRWLNEGLAQIFETALVETGELRVGHVDAKRLSAAQNSLRKKQFPTLEQILDSDHKDFSVAHASDAIHSDRFFQASWALAFYLTFERKLLSTPGLEAYIRLLQRGRDRREAFRELVGMPLAEFERKFQEFILALRPDGSLKPPTPEKP